jgi:hypothetical protein
VPRRVVDVEPEPITTDHLETFGQDINRIINHGSDPERLAHWFTDAFQEPPTLDGVRSNLQRAGQGWLDGSSLPLSIAVKAENGWRLVGWA